MAKETVEIVVNGGLIYMTASGIGDDTNVTFHWRDGVASKERVTTVYLDKQDFTRIPAWLSSFPNIETLRLWGNRLEIRSVDVASVLHVFKKLHRLILCGNFKDGLPDNISDIEPLWELMIGSSGLTELPRRLPQLAHLMKLWVSNDDMEHLLANRFTWFPEVLLRMKGLRELYIANVGMERFPAAK
ncbi:MAG: leucine-rich repeat domain-containing protein, partial [Candidatus Sigynarchaeota archaeon]